MICRIQDKYEVLSGFIKKNTSSHKSHLGHSIQITGLDHFLFVVKYDIYIFGYSCDECGADIGSASHPASQPASRGAKSFQNCLFLNQNILALGLLTPTVSTLGLLTQS